MAFIAAAVCCYSIPVLIDDIKMEQEPETRPTRGFTMFTDRMTQELARRIISGSLKESRRHLLLATQFCKSANII